RGRAGETVDAAGDAAAAQAGPRSPCEHRSRPDRPSADSSWGDRLELRPAPRGDAAALRPLCGLRRRRPARTAPSRVRRCGGHRREGRRRVEAAVAVPGANPELRLRALGALGGVVSWMGDLAMLTHYGAALALAREIGDPKEIALAAYNLSFAYTIATNDMVR